MSIILIGFVAVVGFGFLALDLWQRMTPKGRLLLLVVAVVAFMLLGCDDSGPEGLPWRILRTFP